jgi:hypothetical protein
VQYGPNTADVEDFIARLEGLSSEVWGGVGAAWRRVARPYPGSERAMNWHVVSVVLQATEVIEMRRALERLDPGASSSLPLPDEGQLLRMVAAGERARGVARRGGAGEEGVEAAAGVAAVLALKPWAAEALVENVTAAFNDVWPDWPTTEEPWHSRVTGQTDGEEAAQ